MDCSEHADVKQQRGKMFRHRSDPYRRSTPSDVRELPVDGKRFFPICATSYNDEVYSPRRQRDTITDIERQAKG